MNDVPTATKIAALEEQVRQLTAELEQYRMRLAGALIASEGGDGQPSDALEYLRTCPTITSVMKLRATIDASKARESEYRAEVVRLTAELQGERDDVAACRAEVHRLSKYADRLLAENVRFVNEATDLRERLDSTRQSIITACTGSGCVNASELRFALDQCREHGSTVSAQLTRERERCGVLERECRKWRDEWTKRYNQNADVWMLAVAEMAETDTRHALDAAKFVGKHE